jgi:hypothetical protein
LLIGQQQNVFFATVIFCNSIQTTPYLTRTKIVFGVNLEMISLKTNHLGKKADKDSL